jgi:hypothetical protein
MRPTLVLLNHDTVVDEHQGAARRATLVKTFACHWRGVGNLCALAFSLTLPFHHQKLAAWAQDYCHDWDLYSAVIVVAAPWVRA